MYMSKPTHSFGFNIVVYVSMFGFNIVDYVSMFGFNIVDYVSIPFSLSWIIMSFLLLVIVLSVCTC